jgi:flavorubredoxin
MDTRIDEIADGIHRLSTFIADMPPHGFTFNQYFIDAEQPFSSIAADADFRLASPAAARIIPLERLRWISFGHIESDECGSINQWPAAALQAEVIHGAIACIVSLNDLCDRPPRPLAHGEVLDLGGKRVRYLDTPHVPHACESGLIVEETPRTLFTGDLFTQVGDGPAIGTHSILGATIAAEEAFQATAITPYIAATLRALKDLQAERLAVMHGSWFAGDGGQEFGRAGHLLLRSLARCARGLKRSQAAPRGLWRDGTDHPYSEALP